MQCLHTGYGEIKLEINNRKTIRKILKFKKIEHISK